jgi:hypothetical protein
MFTGWYPHPPPPPPIGIITLARNSFQIWPFKGLRGKIRRIKELRLFAGRIFANTLKSIHCLCWDNHGRDCGCGARLDVTWGLWTFLMLEQVGRRARVEAPHSIFLAIGSYSVTASAARPLKLGPVVPSFAKPAKLGQPQLAWCRPKAGQPMNEGAGCRGGTARDGVLSREKRGATRLPRP